MKWILHLSLLGLAVWSWTVFSSKGKEIERMQVTLNAAYETGDHDEEAAKIDEQIQGLKSERIFSGVLLTFLSAGIAGIFIVVYLLPMLAHKVTHAVFDSGELIEEDVMRDAHSLVAQGDFEGAIEAFKKAAAEQPLNRLPWVEIAKIQREQFHDSAAAIQTFRSALEGQEREINDAAYFLFRLADMYDEDMQDRDTGRAIMQQVIDDFAQTRHSANAIHKLKEWDAQDEAAAHHAEEQAFLARNNGAPE